MKTKEEIIAYLINKKHKDLAKQLVEAFDKHINPFENSDISNIKVTNEEIEKVMKNIKDLMPRR